MNKSEQFEFLIITGMSGAGKSQAIRFFEDRDYFCIDNLPSSLIGSFVDIYKKSEGKIKKLAFVIDIRGWNFLKDYFNEINILRDNNINYKILFLDSKDEVLLNRFKLTRRKHPLNIHPNLLKNIQEERIRLEEIRNTANIIIDTSNLSPRELMEKLEEEFSDEISPHLNITLVSFGFKYGIPIDSDMIFDVRFLPNPYYDETLKSKNGNDLEVQEFVWKCEDSKIFYEKLLDMLEYLLPRFVKEGKSHLNIAVGCSGGKHRSVSFINRIYDYFSGLKEYKVFLSHRDISKS